MTSLPAALKRSIAAPISRSVAMPAPSISSGTMHEALDARVLGRRVDRLQDVAQLHFA